MAAPAQGLGEPARLAESSRGETLLSGQMLTPRENEELATVLAEKRSTKKAP